MIFVYCFGGILGDIKGDNGYSHPPRLDMTALCILRSEYRDDMI